CGTQGDLLSYCDRLAGDTGLRVTVTSRIRETWSAWRLEVNLLGAAFKRLDYNGYSLSALDCLLIHAEPLAEGDQGLHPGPGGAGCLGFLPELADNCDFTYTQGPHNLAAIFRLGFIPFYNLMSL